MTESNGIRHRSGTIWIALTGIATLTLLATLYRNQVVDLGAVEEVAEAASNGTVTFLMEQQWLIGMKLAEARHRELSPQVHAIGRVVPAYNYTAIISSPVTGLVKDAELPVLGQRVRSGEDVLTIEQMPQVADAAQAAQLRLEAIRTESERRRLEQSRAEAQIRLRQAEREWTRARRLHEEELMALQEVEAAETEYDAAESVVSSYAEQLSALAGAPNLETAMRTTAPRQVLSAPIAGRVNQIFKEVGELVQPGEPVLDIVNLDVVWVEAPIFEKDLAAVLDTGEMIFETIAYPGVEFVGELVDVNARIDEETRTATVIFAVSNRELALPSRDLFEPCRRVSRNRDRGDRFHDPAGISDDSAIDFDDLVDLRRVDVNVDFHRVRTELIGLAGDPVVPSRSDRHDQVAINDRLVGIGGTVHSRHSKRKLVCLGKAPFAQERIRYRNLHFLRQIRYCLFGTGDHCPVTDDQERALGPTEKFRGSLDLFDCSLLRHRVPR